jgi:branched-chain amino acid transport system substrate-binding protein
MKNSYRMGWGKKCLVFLFLLGILVVFTQVTHAAPKMANIGVVVPLSGKAAAYGLDFLRGIELASGEINSKGGITVNGEKYQLKIISYDNEMKPAEAVKMAMRLRTLDHCPVICAAESLTAMSVMKYNEKEKFLFMAVSTSPEFTQAGNKLVVRLTTPFTNYVEAVMDEAWRQGMRKAGLVVISFETSKRWSAAFEKRWKEKGGEIVGSEEIGVNESDYYSKLTKLISKNPDVIVNPSAADETAALVTKQARELGYKGRFIFSEACDGVSLIQIAGKKNVEGTLIAAGTSSLKTPEVLGYIKRYKEKFPDGIIQPAGPKGYEGLVMVAKAMEKANTTTDPYKIRATLSSVLPVPKEYRVTGFTEVTKEGETGSPAFVVQIKNGEKVILNQ